VAISDIALKKPLPEELTEDVLAYVGCLAGAVQIEDYRRSLNEAGFTAVQVVDTGKDLNAYAKVENLSGCCGAATTTASGLPIATAGTSAGANAVHGGLADLLRRYNANDYAASVQVYALKTG
jgi:hypothetical protein